MMVRTNSIERILSEFRPGRSFVLTSHSRPDGDAVGSLLGLSDLLESRGCRTEIVLADPVPAVYRTLPGAERIRHASSPSFGDADELRPAVILECDSTERTGLRGLDGRYLINIDHHASGRNYGDLNWIDPEASAVGAMVYELMVAMDEVVSPDTASCIYAAILSDTGGFTSRSTTPATLSTAAELARLGADPARIANDLCFSSPECKVRLLGAALVNMQREGTIAWSWATLGDLERLQAMAEDCDGVVNYLVGIAGVEAAFFAVELPTPGEYRLSLRSKSQLDVAQVAESFGGGGHRAASGCMMKGSLESVIGRVRERVARDSVSLT
jgi:phosphoesterase RecJ-like protein